MTQGVRVVPFEEHQPLEPCPKGRVAGLEGADLLGGEVDDTVVEQVEEVQAAVLGRHPQHLASQVIHHAVATTRNQRDSMVADPSTSLRTRSRNAICSAASPGQTPSRATG